MAKETKSAQTLVAQYVNYMRQEKGLSEKTITARIWFLNDFLACLGENRSLQQIDILTIDEVLNNKRSINGYRRCTIQSYASIIRTFLAYAEAKGLCRKGLAKSIKLARIYRFETLPCGPSWDVVKRLLKSTEGDQPANVRDRAVVMLLAIYGLRSGEVATLCLEDLDWKNEVLYVRRPKNAKSQKFPLSQTVGNAILHYLKQVRPHDCSFREVFLTLSAPYRPLFSSTVTCIVRRRFKLLNVVLEHYGAHSLRHACATHLINEGISLKEISDYLGHLSLDSTRIYAKVDLTNLRKVADFEIGDLM